MRNKARELTVELKRAEKIREDIFLFSFCSGYLAEKACPGNFIHLKAGSTILRRPLSIHKVEGDLVSLLFRVRGEGTRSLSRKKPPDKLNLIGPLGKGFGPKKGDTSILIAGGIGVAPLLFLAQNIVSRQRVKASGQKIEKSKNLVFLGAKSGKEIVCEKEFKKLGFKVKIATEDGSKEEKGFVTCLLEKKLKTLKESEVNIYACGPKEMFSQISRLLKPYPKIKAQVSFEQFMGCGLGVCCACVIPTKTGYKKVCQEGPVFNLKEVF